MPATNEKSLRETAEWLRANLPARADKLQAGLDTAAILQPLAMDTPGLQAALLLPLLPLSEAEEKLLAKRFDKVTLSLLHSASRMRELSKLQRAQQLRTQVRGARGDLADRRVNEENLRKMLLAMVDDIRAVLIELARHLSVLQNHRALPAEARAGLGRVTLDVYAPLANRLGIGQLKWRMEDHALRCLHADEYQRLASALDETRLAREAYIDECIAAVQGVLRAAGLDCEVHGRPKHLYSIWKKMRGKGLAFDGLYDLRALRIIADNEDDCYAALAAVHGEWAALSGEFDDYIATPKANGYRSIHSVIVGPRGKTVEVQIRTHAMHEESELGVAAHWRYKERARSDEHLDNKVARLRQLLQWKEELHGTTADAAAGDERVYVFTPKGAVLELPAGATPIDFAYAIHSEVGHRVRGATIGAKMVPLSYRLQTGEQVHIQTVQNGKPSRDWLRRDMVRTRRARARITQWFKREEFAQHLAEGRAMMERELARLGLEALSYEKIARETPFRKAEELLAAIGAGDYKLSRALAAYRPAATVVRRRRAAEAADAPAVRDVFRVSGVGNVLTRLAKCCKPKSGDDIVGFVTAGRGVSIHLRGCHNVAGLAGDERLLEVEWG